MKTVPENIYLKTCSTCLPGAQSASLSTLNSLQGVLKVSSCSRAGRWKMPLLWLFGCSQMLSVSATLQLTDKWQFVVDNFKTILKKKKKKKNRTEPLFPGGRGRGELTDQEHQGNFCTDGSVLYPCVQQQSCWLDVTRELLKCGQCK